MPDYIPHPADANKFEPLDHVRHAVQYGNDPYVGLVTAVADERGPNWTRTMVWVRWVKPDGDPSDSSTSHAPEELRKA